MQEMNSRESLLEVVRDLRQSLDDVIAEAGETRILEPGTFGPWSFKDVMAHLTGWRLMTAARLEAGLRDQEPQVPWPDHFDEAEDFHEINQWFYETNRDKPLAEVLRESREMFDRVEHLIATMPEDALLQPERFAWVSWTDEALGPAVVGGTYDHYHGEHGPDIRAWLAQG